MDNGTRERPRRNWWWPTVLVATILAGLGIAVMPTGVATADVILRTFDGISTASQKNVWKHMAVLGDQYVIFTDKGIVEGPALIRAKWPFLPERFTHDLDGIAVAFSGPGFNWRNTWIKGNELILFEDTGMIAGPIQQVQSYDGISTYNRNIGFSDFNYVTIKDGNFGTSAQLPLPTTTSPLAGFPGVPEPFTHDLDEVSFELLTEGRDLGVLKVGFFKDNERLIVQSGRIVELVRLDVKWPFLNAFRSA